MKKISLARGNDKVRHIISEILDKPVYTCTACKVLFAVEYLPPFDVLYCPRCGSPVNEQTTLRHKYLRRTYEP